MAHVLPLAIISGWNQLSISLVGASPLRNPAQSSTIPM